MTAYEERRNMAGHVVIGGGIAATQAAETIRSISGDLPITLIAEEERPFYMRPLLADFVAGRIAEDRLWRGFQSVAEAKNVEVIAGQRVTGIDRSGQAVETAGGRRIPYERLLIATGVKPTLPRIPGTDLDGVSAFSAHADAVRLSRWADEAENAVVVGRGLQGVELTRGLRLRGLNVTMVVPDESPWFPALFEVGGEIIEQALQDHGVTVIPLDAPVELVADGGRVAAVRTREGRELPAEIVGFALDQRACVDFLVGSGISLADGVVVDRHLKSTDARVCAAGDVAQLEIDGTRRPMGYGWMRALAQGETAARNMCGEQEPVAAGDEKEAQALYGTSLAARWQ